MDLLTGALLVAVWAFIAMIDAVGPKVFLGILPLFGGLITGVILGDPTTGLLIGAYMQLVSLGLIPIGGSVPPDMASATFFFTAVAILQGMEVIVPGGVTEAGAALFGFALAVAFIGQQLDILARTVNIGLIHAAERKIEEGSLDAVGRLHFLGFIPWGLSRAVPTFFAVWLGGEYIEEFVTFMEKYASWFLTGLAGMATILPAVGLAILLSFLPFRRKPMYFIVGFAASLLTLVMLYGVQIVGFDWIALLITSIIGGLVAWLKIRGKYEAKEEAGVQPTYKPLLDNKTLNNVFLHFLTFEASWNYERMQALGYLYTILPGLKKIYEDKDELKEAMKLHLEFFNCNPIITSIIIGANLALEEQTRGKDRDAIRNFKTAMMGPMAGIGDALFYFLIMGMILLYASTLAYNNVVMLAPIAGLIFLDIITLGFRYWGLKASYKRGLTMLQTMGARFQRLREGAELLGLVVIGAFIPVIVKISTPLFPITTAAGILLSGILALPIFFLAYYLLRKGFSPIRTLLVLMAVGFILGALGLIGLGIGGM
ncbi:MAG: PTS system mannose/fructose/sorbose family transporter subunit IID [Candidatus Baldrarchaeia archaeon]